MDARTRTLLVTALVGVLLATAGCASGDGGGNQTGMATHEGDGGTPAASALQANATTAMQDVETGHLTQVITVSDGNQTETMLRAEGVVNAPDRRMRLDLSGAMLGGQEMTQYVVEDTTYTGLQGRWVRQDAGGEADWGDDAGQLDRQRELLAGSSVEVTGTDEIDGHQVYVLSGDADAANVTAMGDQPGTENLDEALQSGSVELTQYVDADTHHIRRSIAAMDTTVDGQDASLTMTTTISAIDEPVTIELPAAAENAPTLPSGFGPNGSAGSQFG